MNACSGEGGGPLYSPGGWGGGGGGGGGGVCLQFLSSIEV